MTDPFYSKLNGCRRRFSTFSHEHFKRRTKLLRPQTGIPICMDPRNCREFTQLIILSRNWGLKNLTDTKMDDGEDKSLRISTDSSQLSLLHRSSNPAAPIPKYCILLLDYNFCASPGNTTGERNKHSAPTMAPSTFPISLGFLKVNNSSPKKLFFRSTTIFKLSSDYKWPKLIGPNGLPLSAILFRSKVQLLPLLSLFTISVSSSLISPYGKRSPKFLTRCIRFPKDPT